MLLPLRSFVGRLMKFVGHVERQCDPRSLFQRSRKLCLREVKSHFSRATQQEWYSCVCLIYRLSIKWCCLVYIFTLCFISAVIGMISGLFYFSVHPCQSHIKNKNKFLVQVLLCSHIYFYIYKACCLNLYICFYVFRDLNPWTVSVCGLLLGHCKLGTLGVHS